jgi:hypothetical protein
VLLQHFCALAAKQPQLCSLQRREWTTCMGVFGPAGYDRTAGGISDSSFGVFFFFMLQVVVQGNLFAANLPIERDAPVICLRFCRWESKKDGCFRVDCVLQQQHSTAPSTGDVIGQGCASLRHPQASGRAHAHPHAIPATTALSHAGLCYSADRR